jgi:nucleotide-binding universal stress UspA family protein
VNRQTGTGPAGEPPGADERDRTSIRPVGDDPPPTRATDGDDEVDPGKTGRWKRPGSFEGGVDERKRSGDSRESVKEMTLVMVPVRYPLSRHSKATLAEAIDVAQERDADLTVLHVDLYQDSHRTTRRDLKNAVEGEFGPQPHARYVVRRGFLVEETILEEVVAEEADVVVIGSKQAGRWRGMLRRFLDDPDIESFLKEKLDCQVLTVRTD